MYDPVWYEDSDDGADWLQYAGVAACLFAWAVIWFGIGFYLALWT